MSRSTFPRLSVVGDDYVFAELAEDMSLDVTMRVISVTDALSAAYIPGVLEICPGNISVLVRVDPSLTEPERVLDAIGEALSSDSGAPKSIATRIVEIPVLYRDPWTSELVERSRHLNHKPELTDLEFAAECNGFASAEEFIQAHSSTPYIVSMIGFVAGAAWYYQLTAAEDQLEVPKYRQPRTETPERAVGQGEAFTAVYPVSGAGGYQLYGRTPAPVLDAGLRLPAFSESMTLLQPGDIVSFREIDLHEYRAIDAAVEAGTYSHVIVSGVEVDLRHLIEDPSSYSSSLVAKALN